MQQQGVRADRLVGLDSECVRVQEHVYLQTVVSVSRHYKTPTLNITLVQSRYRHLIK
jgi:hypothetical protein